MLEICLEKSVVLAFFKAKRTKYSVKVKNRLGVPKDSITIIAQS